jgi:hypothetical protein
MGRLALAIVLLCLAATATAAEPMTLTVADAVTVFGTHAHRQALLSFLRRFAGR